MLKFYIYRGGFRYKLANFLNFSFPNCYVFNAMIVVVEQMILNLSYMQVEGKFYKKNYLPIFNKRVTFYMIFF